MITNSAVLSKADIGLGVLNRGEGRTDFDAKSGYQLQIAAAQDRARSASTNSENAGEGCRRLG